MSIIFINFGHLSNFYIVTSTSVPMNDTIRAYCGLWCSSCPAYLAYINDDDKIRQETAEKWNSPDFPVSPETLDCAGCKSDGPHFAFVSNCPVHQCAHQHGVETCAHCEDYGCDILQEWFAKAGDEHRKNLERYRASLGFQTP
ncbi:MAG: DUF3795 domain-containing protein [Candidatus Thorarchaeota archaeon]|nr:DUF3795 domain-containing protein [Candidatus Thorarchaeota archaeon]